MILILFITWYHEFVKMNWQKKIDLESALVVRSALQIWLRTCRSDCTLEGAANCDLLFNAYGSLTKRLSNSIRVWSPESKSQSRKIVKTAYSGNTVLFFQIFHKSTVEASACVLSCGICARYSAMIWDKLHKRNIYWSSTGHEGRTTEQNKTWPNMPSTIFDKALARIALMLPYKRFCKFRPISHPYQHAVKEPYTV